MVPRVLFFVDFLIYVRKVYLEGQSARHGMSTPQPLAVVLREKLEEAVSELKILEEKGVADVGVCLILGLTLHPKAIRIIDDLCTSAIVSFDGSVVYGLFFILHFPSEKFRIEEALADFSRVLLEFAPYIVPAETDKLPCIALSVVLAEPNEEIVKSLQERGFDMREVSLQDRKGVLLFKNVVSKVKYGADLIVQSIRDIVQRFTTLKAKEK